MSRPCIALCSTDHCQLLCQTLHIVADCCAHQGFALLLQCLSNRCRAPCLTNQCQTLAQPCRAPLYPHISLQFLLLPWPCGSLPFGPLPQPRKTLQFFSLPRPCGSSPSRSGLYRHVALQLTAVLCPRNSYPRNPILPHLIPNHINAPAVAPADHCVTVRARPSQCRSDHLMTPAFRSTTSHNPCSAIPCKTAHPQSLRISRPRSRLSSPSCPLPRLWPCISAYRLCFAD